jgi:hypothetical protein
MKSGIELCLHYVVSNYGAQEICLFLLLVGASGLEPPNLFIPPAGTRRRLKKVGARGLEPPNLFIPPAGTRRRLKNSGRERARTSEPVYPPCGDTEAIKK